MKNEQLIPLSAAAGFVATALAAEKPAVSDLIAKIKSTDDAVRGPAWQAAGPAGAPAVGPLAAVMTDSNFEVARAAKRAIEKIVRYAGRPGADKERKAVETELIKLLKDPAADVRRHALWMLSEIGDDQAVAPMAALLTDAEAREDARCALQRIPGGKATAALRQAIPGAPEEFKYALADALRARGEKVDGYPSRKLVPTRTTAVTPAP